MPITMEAFAAYTFIDGTGSPRDHFILWGESTVPHLTVERNAQDVLAYAHLGIVTLL